MAKKKHTTITHPHYACSIGAAYTVSAIPGAVPVINCGPGCVDQQYFTMSFCNGFQGSSAAGGGDIPGTNSGENEIVFGGSKKLDGVIKSALKIMKGDLFVVLSGCSPQLVGDDVDSVIKPYREKGHPIVHAQIPGFKGNNLWGHEEVVLAIIDQYVGEAKGVRRRKKLINLWMGVVSPQAVVRGTIERGTSLQIGYYRQDGMSFNEEDTVLDVVPDMHLLGRFLFTPDMYGTRVSRLSGGERRRLYLLTILMKQPNVLIMDEPTNDLDIVTLNVLEEYLLDFTGTLIIVSHDRHFMDRLVDHLLVFCGDGVVKDFIGNFSEYRAFIKDYEAEAKRAVAKPATSRPKPEKAAPSKRKLSYKEQREMESLEAEIEALNAEKAALESQLSSGTLAYDALQAASARIGQIMSLLDEKELRWLELSEIGQ